ncbi:MAG: DUF362 domain-containing protein [Bryobacteraceae bacterium]|nr:DUF362 domain-containing protein [Bryobacteraceae bacterium]
MAHLTRRQVLAAPVLASALAARAEGGKTQIGLVQSTHKRLARPASPEDPLDYETVRDMVWKAIDYGRPRAGSLEAKIKPGQWVVLKPNLVFLRPQRGYRQGDVTDLRVIRAVLEYVAHKSKASRITIAEGGSYRSPRDPLPDNAVLQNGRRVSALEFDWGAQEFPGTGGSIGAMLEEFQSEFPRTKFDFVDLSYDAVRDASGNFRRVAVPVSTNGAGAFGARSDYFVTNTILNCDFLIDMPVMKVHDYCGITCCIKNYVGTAPREAYQKPGLFHNQSLHDEHTVEDRIDQFLVDLAAFHPPDYCVMDAIRGLQYTEHNNGKADQMVRSNLVFAGEDAVAMDAMASYLMGFQVPDIDHLHMAQKRGMGIMDLAKVDARGDDPARLQRYWARPRRWYGRGNREWRVSRNAGAPLKGWDRRATPTDTLHIGRCWDEGIVPGKTYFAAAKVVADGSRKAYLWVGADGRVTALLNGQKVMEVENRTRYRVGQFQQPVELAPGENLLEFRVEALSASAAVSAHLVGPRNDGDTADGIRWTA